ncbi:archaeal DNA polymerase II large subunit [Prevotella sp. CAG:1031]|nr:archaeal DNA polymerase II large subunit [Prevotella sp. CAG:1031]
MENGNAAGEFGKTFLKLLLVVVALRSLDLRLDLGDAGSDCLFVAETVHYCGILLINSNLLCAAKVGHLCVLELHALLFADYGASGEDSDVLKHFLAAITEARSFDSTDFQRATQTVYNESGKSLLIDIFGNDQQWLTVLSRCFKNRKHIFEVRDLLVIKKDNGTLHLALHLFAVSDEIR